MGIVRFDPFRSFEGITRRMQNVASELEKGFNIEYGAFAPRIDIYEDEKNLYLQAELAGVKKEDVKVSINDENVLIIKGEKKRELKSENKEDERCFLRVERAFGEFTRSFMLPENIDKDSISAKYDSGVLEITLAKKEPEKPKEVEIKIA